MPKEVPDYSASLERGLNGVKIGIPKEYNEVEGVDPDVTAALQNAIQVLENQGAVCTEVSLPHTEFVVAVYYEIAPCEASSNLARYDGVKYGLREEDTDGLIDMYHRTRSKGFGWYDSASESSIDPSCSSANQRPRSITPLRSCK